MLDKIKDIYTKKTKQAWHTVTHSLWEYVPFLICIFAMLFSLFTVSVTMRSAYASERELAERSYDYHVIVSGVDEVGMNVIAQAKYSVFANDMVYEVTDIVRHYSVDSGTKTYDMYLRLLTGNKSFDFTDRLSRDDSLKENLEVFKENYKSVLFGEKNSKRVTITPSPLFELEAKRAEYARREFIALTATSAFFAAVLIFFYRTRVNNKSFTYGVYVSFGADRRRLSGTSVLELLVCALFALIPAYILGAIFCRLTIPNAHRVTSFESSSLFVVLPFAVAAIILAVYFPIKRASRKEAIYLISSDDNSNLVSAPMRDKSILHRSFPFGYERLTLWRYRGRLAGLLILSILLCSVFVSSSYATDIYSSSVNTKDSLFADYTISFDGNAPKEAESLIEGIKGVANARIEYTSEAAIDSQSHILVNKSLLNGKLHTYSLDDDYIINDDVTYYSCADGGTAELFSYTYDVEGDIHSVSGNSIIIADTSDNEGVYSFKVGDEIKIGIFLGSKEELQKKAEAEANGEAYKPSTKKPKESEMFLVTGDERLDSMVDYGEYEYITCKIGAVIHGYPSALYGTPIILSDELFASVTGTTPKYDVMSVHLEKEKVHSPEEIHSQIRDVLQAYPEARSEENGKYYSALSAKTESYDVFIKLSGVVCICLIPLMWLYSQLLFYRRRQGELDTLICLSAREGQIRALHMADAVILGACALVCLPLSMGCVTLIHKLYNYTIPRIFLSGANVIITPSVPVTEYIAVALICTVSAALSSLIPYVIFRVSKQKKEKREFFIISEISEEKK